MINAARDRLGLGVGVQNAPGGKALQTEHLQERTVVLQDVGLVDTDVAYDVLPETAIRIQPLPIREEERGHPEAYSNPRLLHNIEREDVRL